MNEQLCTDHWIVVNITYVAVSVMYSQTGRSRTPG